MAGTTNREATKGWIYTNFSKFNSGNNECATKSEIENTGLRVTDSAQRTNNQLVPQDKIEIGCGIVYNKPEILSFSYSGNIPKAGGTVTANVTYRQTYTNTCNNTTGTITSGGTLSFRISGTFTINSSTGAVSADNNRYENRSATAYVKVTMNGLTSDEVACTVTLLSLLYTLILQFNKTNSGTLSVTASSGSRSFSLTFTGTGILTLTTTWYEYHFVDSSAACAMARISNYINVSIVCSYGFNPLGGLSYDYSSYNCYPEFTSSAPNYNNDFTPFDDDNNKYTNYTFRFWRCVNSTMPNTSATYRIEVRNYVPFTC